MQNVRPRWSDVFCFSYNRYSLELSDGVSIVIRVYVDYNDFDRDEEGRTKVYIHLPHNSELSEVIKSGLQVTLYDCDTLEFDGVIGFEEKYQAWYCIVDDSTRRDLPPVPGCGPEGDLLK
jgi:hypothetical protein